MSEITAVWPLPVRLAHWLNAALVIVALAMGAHPYRVCQLHWHNTDYRPLLEKMGIDWELRWHEFEQDLERIQKGEIQFLTWETANAK